MNYIDKIKQIHNNIINTFATLLLIINDIKEEKNNLGQDLYKVTDQAYNNINNLLNQIKPSIEEFEYFIHFYPNKNITFNKEIQQISIVSNYINQISIEKNYNERKITYDTIYSNN